MYRWLRGVWTPLPLYKALLCGLVLKLKDLSAKSNASNNRSATVLQWIPSFMLSFISFYCTQKASSWIIHEHVWLIMVPHFYPLKGSCLLHRSSLPPVGKKVQWTARKITNDARNLPSVLERQASHPSSVSARQSITQVDVNIHDTSNYMRSFVRRRSLKTSVWTWTAVSNSNGHIELHQTQIIPRNLQF